MSHHTQEQKPKKIRESIKQMIKHGISPLSIVFAHGQVVTPDEADLLKEYDKGLTQPKE